MSDNAAPAVEDAKPGPSTPLPADHPAVAVSTQDTAQAAPAEYVSQVIDHRPNPYADPLPPAQPPSVPDIAGRDLVEIKAVFIPVLRYNGAGGTVELLAQDSYEAAQNVIEIELKTDSAVGSGSIDKRFVRA